MSADEVGYAEQEDAVRALSAHYTAGRLDVDTFDDRARAARAATTRAALAGLFTDLPAPHPEGLEGAAPEGTGAAATGASGETAHLRMPDPASGHPAAGPGTPGPGHGAGPLYGDPWYGAPGYNAPGYGTPAYGTAGPAYPPHPGPPVYGPYGYDASAPFGREPYSGMPFSDKQKIVAGLLQLFLPFGIGRFYTGHTGMAIAQLLVTFFTAGIGAIWPFIDGVVMLAGRPTDPAGRPLRP